MALRPRFWRRRITPEGNFVIISPDGKAPSVTVTPGSLEHSTVIHVVNGGPVALTTMESRELAYALLAASTGDF